MRLPFGLCTSSEIFQKWLHQALEGLENVICVADDILVYGKDETQNQSMEDHDKYLKCFLQRCREVGLRLNGEKNDISCSRNSIFGNRVTCEGLSADPGKFEAIVKPKTPTSLPEVQRLGGMVNYLARYLQRLSEVMMPLRKPTRKNTECSWGQEQEKAFQDIIYLVTNAPVLTYYDPSKHLEIQCDSSKSGIGSVLLQGGRPITYASRVMTTTEGRYAQIEKEMLVIVFSLHKFHQYTFGHKMKIFTDHKPLQAIVKKPLCLAPKRLQGMILKTQQYGTDIKYQPGEKMFIVDFLSRAYLEDVTSSDSYEREAPQNIKC